VRNATIHALLVIAVVAVFASACGPARPAGGPYPAACAQWGYSERRCEAIVERGLASAGLRAADVASIDLRPFEQKATLGGPQVALIRFGMVGGGETEVEVWCVGIDSGRACNENAAIAMFDGIDRDVPCEGEPPAGCATIPPSPGPDAVSAAKPLRVANLAVPIVHLGCYEIEVGSATLPDGYLTVRSATIVDSQPETYWIDEGIRLEVRPDVAGRPPIGSVYRDPFDGSEPVTIFLVFTVTDLDSPSILVVDDIVVR
jgi:hypothetical protein